MTATITRNNPFNVTVEIPNTAGAPEIYSVVWYDEANSQVARVSVRRDQKADGSWKWGTLNARHHGHQIGRVLSLIRQSGV
jgi:hypothetical protein